MKALKWTFSFCILHHWRSVKCEIDMDNFVGFQILSRWMESGAKMRKCLRYSFKRRIIVCSINSAMKWSWFHFAGMIFTQVNSIWVCYILSIWLASQVSTRMINSFNWRNFVESASWNYSLTLHRTQWYYFCGNKWHIDFMNPLSSIEMTFSKYWLLWIYSFLT